MTIDLSSLPSRIDELRVNTPDGPSGLLRH